MPALSGGSPVLNPRFSRFSRYLLEFVWLRCLFVGEVTDLLRLSSPLTLCILADRQCYVHEVRLCMLLAKRSERKVWFGKSFVNTPIFDRSDFLSEQFVTGPAVITEHASTTIILPNHTAKVDSYGNIHISKNSEG